MLCPKCGKQLRIKANKKTNVEFWGCDFPRCDFTISYVNPQENEKVIRSIIDKFENDIRQKLSIPNFVNVAHEFNIDMQHGATCTTINKNNHIINWNKELKRSNLSKIVRDLAHEYRHVYQEYYNTIDKNYDTNIKWRLRPHEDDAINFMNEYIDDIILNYIKEN
ncbi:topoisomerase DNA-binding C4 zinc finger domain-containing protein [Clostridium botulinum]